MDDDRGLLVVCPMCKKDVTRDDNAELVYYEPHLRFCHRNCYSQAQQDGLVIQKEDRK